MEEWGGGLGGIFEGKEGENELNGEGERGKGGGLGEDVKGIKGEFFGGGGGDWG